MAKKNSLGTFTYPLKVEVRKPDFELSDSIRHLDVKSLGKASRAEIEIGHVKGGCCGNQTVRAIIRKGMVTGLRVDKPPKKSRTPISPDLENLLQEARKTALKQRGPGVRFPLAVHEFLTGLNDVEIQTLVCIRICIWGDICITCCWRTDTPGADAICGHITINTTVFD